MVMADTPTLDIPDGVYEDVPGWSGMIRHPSVTSLTAGAYPVKPPSSWFSPPKLSSLTPLTVEDDGRVYGHIAAWHTSHIGMAGGVKPPRSKSDYAYYKTGVVKCDDDKMINVGQITLTGGHAPLNAGVSKAVAHYDDTASAIMDVTAGEDKHGIWVAGALRPEVSDAQLRSIRASSVSGDWRPINGKLELVAVCAVNAPGFPIPRARVASGAPIALVAAGIEPLVEIAMQDRIEANVEQGIAAGLELFRERVLRLENVVLADSAPEEAPRPDPEQLRKRVRGGSALAASLRERVRGTNHSPEVVDDVESLAASLRERVRGSDAGPKAQAPEGALTAARKPWNPLLHPRGADGRFIEVGAWVRWLRQGFGTARRGQVVDIIPDPTSRDRNGTPRKALARVRFPDGDGNSSIHEVSFDEIEKTAPPKGQIDESDDGSFTDSAAQELDRQIRKRAAHTVGHLIHDDEHHINDDEDRDDRDKEPFYGLVISKALDTAGTYEIGETITYEVIAENKGSVSTGDYSFTDPVPEGLEFVSASGDGEISGASVSWTNRPSLPPGGTDSVTVTAKVTDPEALSRLSAPPSGEDLPEFEDEEAVAAALETLRVRVRGSDAIVARATEYWTDEKREEAAKSGVAMPDGQYPIEDKEDLKKSIAAYGRAKNPVLTKRHIMRRASMIGETDLIPDGWAGKAGFDPAKHLRGQDGRFVSQGKSRRSSAAVVSDSGKKGVKDKATCLREKVHKGRGKR